MSCIDAAIIKALVEHIGIDPEDVPVGSPHECVKYTAGNGIAISGDNVISSTNTCQCTAVADEQLDVQFGTVESGGKTVLAMSRDKIDSYIKAGDMLVIESISDGTRYYYYCILANGVYHMVRFIGSQGLEEDYTVSGSTLTTPFESSMYRPVGLYRINTLESVVRALKMFIPFAALKLPKST